MHCVQTSYGAPSGLYPAYSGDPLPGTKQPVREPYHPLFEYIMFRSRMHTILPTHLMYTLSRRIGTGTPLPTVSVTSVKLMFFVCDLCMYVYLYNLHHVTARPQIAMEEIAFR